MTFLDDLLSDTDRVKARNILMFKNEQPMGLGTDPELRHQFQEVIRTEMEPIAQRLHDAVTARVQSDPMILAMADQKEAELVDSPRRRQG